MKTNHLKVLVGGVQLRDGVTTVTDIMGRIFTRAGLHAVAVEKGYASTIYGAHQFDPMLITAEPPLSWGDDLIDMLVALDYDSNPDVPQQPNRDTILRHGSKLVPGGVLLYDSSTGEIPEDEFAARDVRVFALPARQIAQRELKREVVKNMIMVGALFRMLEFDEDRAFIGQLLEERFLRKGRDLVNLNLEALHRGEEAVNQRLRSRGWEHVGYRVTPGPRKEPAVFLGGNDALGIGAIHAGVRFYAGYPITPASSILEFMEAHLPRYGGRALQGQNERESIRAAIGASIAGVRSMVASSGPGISLKIEEIGLSGTAEIPLVIVDAQRSGPSTGMPTRTEQGDLHMVTTGNASEIPRIVLAPSTVEECYALMIEAVRLADRYQCPVFFLTDLELSEGRVTIAESVFTSSAPRIDRGALVTADDVRRDGYRRFEITESGISPRLFPGTPGAVFKASGTEHDEFGFVTIDPAKRVAMYDKRMRKMETYLRDDAKPPQVFGTPEGIPLLVGWGSTKPALLEARQQLAADGIEVAVVHFTHLWPFPAAMANRVFQRATMVIVAEMNYSGNFASLIQSHCLLGTRRILKYNGRPFFPSEIAEGVRQVMRNGATVVRIGGKEPVRVEAYEGD